MALLFLSFLLPAGAQPDKKRLKKLDDYVTAAMETWSVPGLSIAVVQKGEVIWSKGYGLSDVENKVPVTDQTVFAIGSSSKAFTALAVAMLVEDGLIKWDEPIKTYLPDFEMQDPVATEEMTAIDLLSHVSGLPRHDLAWYGSPKTREELYESLQYLEPTESFRGGWQYQNLMFMTAGVLIERVSGKTWEEFVQLRILDPLGMTSTSTSLKGLEANKLAAKGYEEKEDEIVLMPYKNIDNIGPAGSINSNVGDMAKWMNMMLYGGMVDTNRVVEAAAVSAVQRPRAIMPSGVNEDRFYLLYGLGWMITSYRGHLMVEHGGNIDGFSAGVCLLPQDSIGIVVLTNKNGTPITSVLEFYLADLILDLEEKDWSDEVWTEVSKQMEAMKNAENDEEDIAKVQGTKPSHPLADYAGTYENEGYGTMTIVAGDTSLTGSYNGLDIPFEHYHYDVFQATDKSIGKLKIQFFLNMDGEISSVESVLQQGVEPIRFTKKVEVLDLASNALEEYVGAYELMGIEIAIAIEDEHLTMTVPGQPTYTLDPIKKDAFRLQELEGFSAIFSRDEAGKITALTSVQPNGNFKATRKE
ncbi:MAG: serine hydrolase [Bacteroidia bacterium]|nr:serine hydrolase [Bacteroidia bacterium]